MWPTALGRVLTALGVAAALAALAACDPSSRLTPEEQAWCATHRDEVARVEEFARDQDLILEGPVERRPMATGEVVCLWAFESRHLGSEPPD